MAGVDGADVEQVVDERVHALGGARDDAGLTAGAVRLGAGGAGEQRGGHADGVERVLEVVGDDGDQVAAGLGGLLRGRVGAGVVDGEGGAVGQLFEELQVVGAVPARSALSTVMAPKVWPRVVKGAVMAERQPSWATRSP